MQERDQNKKTKTSNVTMVIKHEEVGPQDESTKTISKLRKQAESQQLIIERLVRLNSKLNKKLYEFEKLIQQSNEREEKALVALQRDHDEIINIVRIEQRRREDRTDNQRLTLKESVVLHKNELLCDALKASCKGFLGLYTRGTREGEKKKVLDAIAFSLRYGLEELDATNYTWLDNRSIPHQIVWNTISDELGFSYRIQRNIERAVSIIRSNEELQFIDFNQILNRKERKDCIQGIAKNTVESYCHNDNNSHRPDSNGGDPVEINGEKHPVRIWEDIPTWDEKYEDFRNSEEYKQFQDLNPGTTIGKTIFRRFVCPCLKDPKLESCVDLIMTQVDECARAIERVLVQDKEFKSDLERCNCYLHSTYKYATLFRNIPNLSTHGSFIPVEELVRGKCVRKIIESTCCPSVPDEELACGHGASKRVPAFIPWSCVNESKICQGCMKKQPMNENVCHTYRNNLRTYRCLVWTRVSIENSPSMQEELQEKEMTFLELLELTMRKIKQARVHYVNSKWNQHARDLVMEMLDPKLGAALFTDFAATVNLRAKMTDNSSIDSHALIQVFYKFSNRRIVEFERKDGSVGEHLLLNTDVTQYFGATHSKGKSNDWVFATNALLNEIDKHERKREIQFEKDANGSYILDPNGERIQTVFTYWVCTDGAPTQYKCRQNFLFIASIQERFPGRNIRIVHIVATKYGFKGVWDGDGGISKAYLVKEELKGHRSSDAESAFRKVYDLRKQAVCKKVDLESTDEKITMKKVCTIDSFDAIFIADRRDQYLRMRFPTCPAYEKYKYNVLFLNRSELSKRCSDSEKPLRGTKNYFQFRGAVPEEIEDFRFPDRASKQKGDFRMKYGIIATLHPCACEDCRSGKFSICKYSSDIGEGDLHLMQRNTLLHKSGKKRKCFYG